MGRGAGPGPPELLMCNKLSCRGGGRCLLLPPLLLLPPVLTTLLSSPGPVPRLLGGECAGVDGSVLQVLLLLLLML